MYAVSFDRLCLFKVSPIQIGTNDKKGQSTNARALWLSSPLFAPKKNSSGESGGGGGGVWRSRIRPTTLHTVPLLHTLTLHL